ncbi:MAG: preprotein translocase subunit TatC, partial [Candidatus Tectomicrobia bacterium]|nr:preprotein translocase subunit TatC [Candidatus Tectomicrobia bacterium]
MATEPRLLTTDLMASLERVRWSVLRLLIAFAVASAAAYPLAPYLLHWLVRPLKGPLVMYAPLEGLMGYLTVSMTTSLCLIAPLLLYEANRLLRSVGGLPPRVALGSTVAAGGLFLLGASFCYMLILPVTLRFLL